MSLPDSLFQNPANATLESPCWLWLLVLTSGAVVQITFSPAADRAHVERIAKTRHASLFRVVPVPSAKRLLQIDELAGALAGRAIRPVEIMPSVRWLARVAWLLEASPDELLSTGVLIPEDTAECAGTAPQRAVETLRAGGMVRSPSASPPVRPHRYAKPLVHLSAATASPQWRKTRDQYHRHLFACAACYAPTARYCPTGAALRATYHSMVKEPSA